MVKWIIRASVQPILLHIIDIFRYIFRYISIWFIFSKPATREGWQCWWSWTNTVYSLCCSLKAKNENQSFEAGLVYMNGTYASNILVNSFRSELHRHGEISCWVRFSGPCQVDTSGWIIRDYPNWASWPFLESSFQGFSCQAQFSKDLENNWKHEW